MKRKKTSRFNSFVMVMLIISFLFGFCGVGQLFGDKKEIPQTEEVLTLTGNPAKVIPEKEPVIDSGNYIVKTWDERIKEMFINGEDFNLVGSGSTADPIQISTAEELAFISFVVNNNGIRPYPIETIPGYIADQTNRNPKLPAEYNQMEFLESDGNQFIASGVTECAKIVSKISISDNASGMIFGYRTTHWLNAMFGSLGTKKFIRIENTAHNPRNVDIYYNEYIDQVIDFEVDLYENKYVLGETTGSFNNYEKQKHNGLAIFGTNHYGGDYGGGPQGKGYKIYSMDIYNFQNELVRSYVPCYRIEDYVTGFYDLVNKDFVRNGDGNFNFKGTVKWYVDRNPQWAEAFVLTNDIYLNDGDLGLDKIINGNGDVAYAPVYNDGGDNILYKWSPIEKPLTLYGNGHKIYGMYVNQDKNDVGLFARINTGWYLNYIEDICIRNSVVYSPNNNNAAGFVGYGATAVIKNCSFDGYILNAGVAAGIANNTNNVNLCENYGIIITMLGDACGITNGTTSGSANYGEIIAVNNAAGIGGNASDSINYAQVNSAKGKAFGVASSSATNCVNYGRIKGKNSYGIGNSAGKTCINYGNIYGTSSATGISNTGTFENSKNYGEIVSTEGSATGLFSGNVNAKNCYNYGTVKGKTNVGGLYSGISGTIAIYNCINYGDVTSESANAGGLIGVVSSGNPNIIRCENVGKVTAKTTSTTTYAGGLIGSITAGTTTIESCTNEGKVSGNTATGFVGQATGSCTIKNSLNNGDITSSTYEGATLSSTFGVTSASQLTNCITSSKINGVKVNACAYVKDGYFSEQYRTGKIISSNANHTAMFQGVIDADYIKENNFIDFTPTPEDSNKLYTKLEYIQSDGNQYIDTGVSAGNTISIDLDISILNYAECPIIGTDTFKWGDQYAIQVWKNNLYLFDSTNVISNIQNTSRMKIHADPQGVTKIEGFSDLDINRTISSKNIYMARWGNTYGAFKLYSLKIYNKNKTIRDFIPAKRNSDGMVGLFDTIEGKFYTDANGGNFEAGPKASLLPVGYTELESIKSNGTQYIDTKINYTYNTKIEATMQATASGGNLFGMVKTGYWTFGVRVGSTSYYEGLWLYNPSSSGLSAVEILTSSVQGNICGDIIFDKTGLQVNGVKKYTSKQQQNFENTLSGTIGIFAAIDVDSNNSPIINSNYVILYSFKIWDNGTIVRNFIPAKRNSDGMIGLYDTIEGKFYTDANGGNFEVGD